MATAIGNYQIELSTNQVVDRQAWTGGDTPPKGFNDPVFRELRSFYFRDQLKDCGGLDYWKSAGTGSMERARIFWNRATLDAWITCKREKLIAQTN